MLPPRSRLVCPRRRPRPDGIGGIRTLACAPVKRYCKRMRLRKIKLAGFKSFVDPTTLIVPDKLVAIVGPNGCGKSNIIDAVTWVMGESSAKHLRGDALTDVIFNGSGARQPTGQASVELIFENHEGKLGGRYASYSEISVRRQINREAQSGYYLNGARCRRKDIQGIFLGTGLGPRNYAIIEQGMISRLIEAKPEELREFIEEAAGISRFRERRRETENRIRHTRENIARLADIREELRKRLSHLQRQAKAAERYQTLKQEERRLRAELLALQWRALNEQAQERREVARRDENRVEEGMAKLRETENAIERQRQRYNEAGDGFNQTQSGYYEIGADISQLEQKIEHIKDRVATLDADLETARAAERESLRQKQQDERELQSVQARFGRLEPQLQGSRSESDDAYNALTSAEEALQAWQTEWDSINAAVAQYNHRFERDQTRGDYLREELAGIAERRLALRRELERGDVEELATGLRRSAAGRQEMETGLREQRQRQAEAQETLQRLRGRLAPLNERLSALRLERQNDEADIAALAARQAGDALDHKDALDAWLRECGLRDAPRLIDKVTVEQEWFLAFETVAGRYLQDLCVDDLRGVSFRGAGPDGAGPTAGRIGLLDAAAGDGGDYTPKPIPRLLDKLRSEVDLAHLLQRVYIADDPSAAKKILRQLETDESVITRDGLWLSRHWTRVNRPAADEPGILSREQRLNELRQAQRARQQEIERVEREVADTHAAIEEQEREIAALQERQARQQDGSAAARARHAELNAKHEQAQRRLAQVEEELDELELKQQAADGELADLQARLEQVEAERGDMLSQRKRMETLRKEHRASLEKARDKWQSTHKHSHEIALELESCSSRRASIEQAIKRNEIQVAGTRQRISELQHTVESQRRPMQELKAALEAKLDERTRAEAALAKARDAAQARQQELRAQEQARVEVEREAQARRAVLEESRLRSKEIETRRQTLDERLAALGRRPAELLEDLKQDAGEKAWEKKLEAVERKVQRLGPINLAAIDEYGQLSERKTYLDSQDQDLTQALDTLEGAIRKIDRETRTRFRETFDRLDGNIKRLFPALFGGGHAYLEMTGRDLLETGVTIMARPPGKKNSTIHLLSGGEKALAAVALVFSIFQLNPAPFCILDEVDAPLDDANVRRFSELVKKMSAEVQFIVVTHNKITMEIAERLLGVTMQEPGVSRLVSVDVDEAVEMAATA